MNKLLITAVVIFGFSSAAQAEPSKEAEKSQKVDPTLSKQEKK
ncbi:hypothetical protein [Candidatus Odyssella thessalonicensis]|nr:hypothetical protein [Candidatus Odyssella thessalonicensis]